MNEMTIDTDTLIKVFSEMIPIISRLMEQRSALYKEYEHRVSDCRITYLRKHGGVKKMRKAK